MGANHDELVRKGEQEGKKLAAEHDKEFARDVRKMKDYESWVSGTAANTHNDTTERVRKEQGKA